MRSEHTRLTRTFLQGLPQGLWSVVHGPAALALGRDHHLAYELSGGRDELGNRRIYIELDGHGTSR
ncbi:hypothetical protein GCM10010269_65520 [Streptomyces humidus]|uniref:Uncharacterized protein n=1 Tax=Streptomyces humidus TaxID=52259 RepID=A0A918G3A0_9ACTN|nr:hypothetical protein GCM10010269_65520 [Streptomyces humidus]